MVDVNRWCGCSKPKTLLLKTDGRLFVDALKQIMALKRYVKEEEIAAFVMYLVSPEAAFITGASLNVDGGFTA